MFSVGSASLFTGWDPYVTGPVETRSLEDPPITPALPHSDLLATGRLEFNFLFFVFHFINLVEP